jgi:uncharacterized protein (TIGR03437 family)
LNRVIHIFAVALALLLTAGGASAQTPANVTVVSGNGQLICQCQYGGSYIEFSFRPMVVKVTDTAGAPVANTTVNWSVSSGGYNGSLVNSQTTTDSNGVTTNIFNPGPAPFGNGYSQFQQTTITASTGGPSANFTLTQGIQTDASLTGGIGLTPFTIVAVDTGRPVFTALTGQVGSTVTPGYRIRVVTTTANAPIPNVSVYFLNDQAASAGPVAACQSQGQSNAGTNTVLTDSNGEATCNPILGGLPNVDGTGALTLGGYLPDPAAYPGDTNFPSGYRRYELNMRFTPGAPGSIRSVSGTNQTAQAGQALASPLVVEVLSATGSAMGGQLVNWTVSPSTGGNLGSAQTTTDSSGRTSNTLRFPTSAAGPVVVTATLAADATKTTTFAATATPLITVTSMSIVSGNSQNAILNTSFAPLVVQVNSTAGPASGVAVAFSISGPGTLSAPSATTGADGRAQVTVQAGGTTGPVTVTASAAGFTQTFNLTVTPAGPSLVAGNFYNAADLQRGALSPCSLATIIAPGIAGNLQGMVTAGIVGQLPGSLANSTVTVGGTGAPLSSIGRNAGGQETLTFQVPCEVNPGSSVPVVVNAAGASGSVNIPIQAVSPGIFTQTIDGVTRAVVVRPEGSFVTPTNPARRGENLTALVTGLGPSIPVVGTNSVAAPGSITAPQGTVVVGMAGRGVPLISAQMSPDQVGVWLVQFTVPSDIATGNQSFSISVVPTGSSTSVSSGSGLIPVQ